MVERLKVAFPRAAHLFSWYADEAHYQAVPAQDHTPFSQTGWPKTSPEWWVFATDIMHRPDLGVNCDILFAYYLVEAKAGRMPWLKYIIWKGKIYDVRNGWKADDASGHFDHMHLSGRTDHRDTTLGQWSVTPTGGIVSGLKRIAFVSDGQKGAGHETWYFGDGITYRTIITWPEHQNLIASGAEEKQYRPDQDWREWVGRIEEKPMPDPVNTPPVHVEITQDMLNAAVLAAVPALVAELVDHIRLE